MALSTAVLENGSARDGWLTLERTPKDLMR